MAAHVCEACGLLHDTPTQQESPEVAIARIQAESALAIEKVRARQERDWNETRVEVAEVEAEAQVASAEATAEVVAAAIAPEEPETPDAGPVVVEVPAAVEDQAPDDAPPPVEEHPEKPSKPRGLGMW